MERRPRAARRVASSVQVSALPLSQWRKTMVGPWVPRVR